MVTSLSSSPSTSEPGPLSVLEKPMARFDHRFEVRESKSGLGLGLGVARDFNDQFVRGWSNQPPGIALADFNARPVFRDPLIDSARLLVVAFVLRRDPVARPQVPVI